MSCEQISKKSIKKKEIFRNREKERSLEFVMEKVSLWRKLYLEGNDGGGEKSKNKMNLTEAAKIVGLPRKTLDDYHGQIKKGETSGFNF